MIEFPNYFRHRWLLCLFIFIGIQACTEPQPKEWTLVREIDLGEVTPIGLAFDGEDFWISDGDHNQMVKINLQGKLLERIDHFERPMHIAYEEGVLYIPEYGSDQIIKLVDVSKDSLVIEDALDAPAAVDVMGEELAIADFYNQRILYREKSQWLSFGTEGKADGEFYYPTDVQLTDTEIYVADAYNHRIQVFDKAGQWLRTIGAKDSMNATTGIFVGNDQLFATDFENDRLMVYSKGGELEQVIDQMLNKPTDVIQLGDSLYLANYKGRRISVYAK